MRKITIDAAILLQRPIAVSPLVIKVTGSAKLALLWSQINYWTDKTENPEGWIYKTREKVFDETGLSRKEQETARALGAELGILESRVMGTPPTVHFRVDMERMIQLTEEWLAKNESEVPKRAVSAKPTRAIEWLRNIPAADMAEMTSKYHVTESFVRERAEDVIDYCESKGKRYSDYKAALRNFIKSHLERHPEQARKPKEPTPGESEQRRAIEEAARPRTPEEQARIDEGLRKVRESLASRWSMKKS